MALTAWYMPCSLDKGWGFGFQEASFPGASFQEADPDIFSGDALHGE